MKKSLHPTPAAPRLSNLALALGVVFCVGLCATAQAQSLVDLYQAARTYDATYQSARAQHDATVAKGLQAKAGILPSVKLTAGVTGTRVDSNPSNPANPNPSFNTQTAGIGAQQPLYNPANWATYEQGKKQIAVAELQMNAAEQDLIVRTAKAYFDVLAAQDNLSVVQAQKAAVSEQLASAKRNFEVGTTTITDSREAQAQFDLVRAQEIAAQSDLQVKQLALDQLVGMSNTRPKPLAAPVALPAIAPADVNAWVQQSEANNPAIAQTQIALDVAKLETQKAEAGHKPTLDLNLGYNIQQGNGTANGPGNYRNNVSSIGLAFSVPLFAGFAIQNHVKETLALEDKARSDLDNAKRSVAQGTRAAYFGVLSGQSQVSALEAAETSSQSALDANKLGYQVGVRINIDVLNAQSQLFTTKAKLAKARYDVLVGDLTLRQAAGTLQADDLQRINALLAK